MGINSGFKGLNKVMHRWYCQICSES